MCLVSHKIAELMAELIGPPACGGVLTWWGYQSDSRSALTSQRR